MINSLDILASVNKSVAIIAKNMSDKNGAAGDADSTAKLSRGNIAGDGSPKATEAKAGGLGLGEIKQMVSILGGIPAAVKAVAGLSGRVMKNFEKVMISFYEAFHKILKYDFKKDKIKTLNDVNEAVLLMTAVVKNAAPLVLIAPLATLGMMLSIPFFAAAGLAMKLLIAMKIDTKGIVDLTSGILLMTRAALAASALLLVCIGIGALIQKIGSKPLLWGLGVLGTTLVLLTGIILLTGLAGRAVKEIGAIDGIKNIITFALATMGMVILAATFGLLFSTGKWKEALVGGLIILGATLGTMMLIVLIAGAASALITKTGAFENIGKIMLFAVFCFGLVIASTFLARFARKNWKDIALGLSAVSGVMIGLIGIAWLASKLADSTKKGIVSLSLMSLLAFATIGLVYTTVKVSQTMKDPNVRKDMLITLAFAGGILVAFGALAVAAGALSELIIPGAIALGATIGFATLTLSFVNGVISLIERRKEAGVTWNELAKEVGGIALVTGVFGLLASGFSLLLMPVLLAMPAIGIVVGFSYAVMGVVGSVVELKKKTDEAGGSNAIVDFIKNGISPILKAFNRKNLSLGMGILEFFGLMEDIAKIKKLSYGILVAVDAISRIAEISDVVGDGMIRKVISRDKDGNVKYSDWVDPVAVGRTIVNTLSTFAKKMSEGFEDVKIKNVTRAADAMMIIGQIIDPISKFVEILTAYESDREGYLKRITFNEKGELVQYPSVNVVSVANTIAGTVSTFIGTLFSQENANNWTTLLYGEGTTYENWVAAKRRRKGIKEMMGMLGMVIEPITNFIDVMSNFSVGGDGVLHKLIEDEKEGLKQGPAIDFKTIGTHIAGAVTAFVSSLFDRSVVEGWSVLMYGDSTSIWDFSGRRVARRRTEAIEKMTGILGQVIEPVANFIDVMLSFSADSSGIHKVLYDGKGGWTTGPAIDFKRIGTDIATGVTSFVNALYAKDYMESFNGNAESLKNVVGSFNEVIDLVNSIAGDEGDITKATKNVNDFYLTISQFNKNLSSLTDKKATESFNKAKTNINSADTELKKVTDTFGKFDNALYKDKQKRIDDINNLADAFKKIKDNIKGMSSDLSSLTTALKEIGKADIGKIENVSSAIRSTGGGGGILSGGSRLSANDIVNAIQEALQGLKFETDAATSSFEYGGDEGKDIVGAIRVLIRQLSSMDYTISKK